MSRFAIILDLHDDDDDGLVPPPIGAPSENQPINPTNLFKSKGKKAEVKKSKSSSTETWPMDFA